MEKKILALALAATMTLGMVAPVMAEDEKPLIGCMFYSNTDALGSQTYELINACAESLGAETLWEVGNFDNDSQLTAIQNLIAAGVDGLVFQPMDYDFLPKVIDVCEEAGIYLGVMFGPIQDEETVAYMAESEYFVGYSYEHEASIAEKHINILADLGATKLGVGWATPGSALADWANEGFKAGIDTAGMEVLAEYSTPIDQNSNTVSSNVQNFISAYPDMNGMVFGGFGGGIGEAVTQLLVSANAEVKISARDIFVGMEKAFEAGIGASFSGATAPDGLYMFSCVYNAIKGTPVSDSYVELIQPALFITSAEDCSLYEEYIANTENYTTVVFNDEYYQALSKANNADLTPESIQKMMDTYTIEWVSERVAQ